MHLVIDARCVHRHMGGIGVAAKYLIEHLGKHRRGHRITALIGPEAPYDFAVPGIEFQEVRGVMIDERFEALVLPDLLADLKADVYLNPTFSVPTLKTTPFQIAIIHDVVFEDKPEWVDRSLREFLSRGSRFTAENADHIITVSDFSLARIRDIYGVDESRITRIYNGLPADAFAIPSQSECERVRQKYQIERPYLLFLSTVEIKKGISELLAAFTDLHRSGFDGDLLVVGGGGGPWFPLDQALAETGCRQRIRTLGYVDDADKKPLLVGSELLVYPSHYEGFGLPPLEAMALGVPCLVNRATSLPEVVGDCGLMVDVNDRAAFASALRQGLNDPGFRQHAKTAGPLRARQHFSWPALADRYLDVCESLVEV